MGLEFEDRLAVLGKFGTVCDTPLLDWRHKCPDEILDRLMLVLVDQFYSDFEYKALISSSSSINFREAWASEGGENNPNCCPSTANAETVICDFKLPRLQTLSIGTEPRCYQDWEERFCNKFPRYKSWNPFVVNGGQISLRKGREDGPSGAFVGMVANELSQAIWNHLYFVLWVGRDNQVDQFNGINYYLENGISTLTDCTDYPTKPTKINMAEYILGAAAVAAGETVGPGDIVLAVGDPARPVDAPATNVITIYGGTIFETSVDITGMDTIDVLTMWYELVTNEWGVDVREWMLGTPKSGTKCLSQVAACKQSCKGDCRALLLSADNRDLTRAQREAEYIRNRSLRLYPYEETLIPMRQSPFLRQFNRLLFVPERFSDLNGQETNWMLWAWMNQRGENEAMFQAFPALRQMLPGINDGNGSPSGYFESSMLYDGMEFKSIGDTFEGAAWDWLWDKECNSVRWWANARSGLVPQMPWLWLCIDGVDCETVVVLPCPDPIQPKEHAITAATDSGPSQITFSVTGDPVSDSYTAGDKIDVQSAAGTTYKGTVTTVTDPGTLVVTFTDPLAVATITNFVTGYTRVAVGPQ